MEPEIWQRLPEDWLFMILARLPIRVLGKMRTVCKQWNSLLSSRDALQVSVPNWSLHSTTGFLLQIRWDIAKRDVELWVIEGRGYIYKLPLLNRIVLDTCKGIAFCHAKNNWRELSIGIPGTHHWRELPPAPLPFFYFRGMAFDSRCTLLLGRVYPDPNRIEMCTYDSDSNSWTTVSMMVPDHINPSGKALFSRGKFYWYSGRHGLRKLITAFNIVDGQWTEIPLPEGGGWYGSRILGEYDGQVVLVDRKGCDSDFFRVWKLNEAGRYEIWRELRATAGVPIYSLVNFTSNGLMMVSDRKTNMSIFNSKGELVVQNIRIPRYNRMSHEPTMVEGFAFESNNLWWPWPWSCNDP